MRSYLVPLLVGAALAAFCAGVVAFVLVGKERTSPAAPSPAEPAAEPSEKASSRPPGVVSATAPTNPIDISGAPASVAPVIDPAGHDGSERLTEAKKLRRDLSEEEKSWLIAYLKEAKGDLTVRNQILIALHEQNAPLADLTELLVETAQDEKKEMEWRGFCVQHLRSTYFYEGQEAKRPEIEKRLMEFAGAQNNPVGGTAFMTLLDIAEPRKVGEERAKELRAGLGKAAAAALGRADSCKAVRIASIQTAARLGMGELLPGIVKLAGDEEEDVMVRLASVGAIGELGDTGQAPLLEKLSANKRLAVAAKEALRKVKDKKPF